MKSKSIVIVIIVILILTIFLSGCVEYYKYRNIQYQDIPNVDPNIISLDLYVPKISIPNIKNLDSNPKIKQIAEHLKIKYNFQNYNKNTPFPVMIWVHGGGWRSGDKDNQLKYKIPMFIDAGWIFVGVNYRLSPYEIPDDPADFDPNRIMYPIHNQDVAAAIAWVYNHISEYGGDPNQISLMGHSAGAGIVAAIGTNQTFLKDNGLNLSMLKHVVCLDTEGYDVREQIENGSNAQSMVYMNAFGINPSVWDDASPINNIELDEELPSYFIVTRGTKDRINLSEQFSVKVNNTGANTELIYALEYTHGEVNDAIGNPKDNIITPTLKNFLGFKNHTS
jgi:acetyl esterase/lipase